MRRLFGVSVAMWILSGCWGENSFEFTQNTDFFEHAENGEMASGTSEILCEPSFTRSLRLTKNNGISPEIEFSSANETAANIKALASGATSKERCNEILHYLSKAEMKIGISFFASEAEEKQMVQGKTINMQSSGASLVYSDGSLEGKFSGIDLRCEAAFPVSCPIQKIDGHKECNSYNVNYPDQTCTFRASFLPFGFSDHRNTQLEIFGELNFMASGEAQIKFNKISWIGIY